MANARSKSAQVTCDDCFFRREGLCALDLPGPCSTFRHADRGLAPERQLSFTFRMERPTPLYAVPAPGTA